MQNAFELALANLLAPSILFFALWVLALIAGAILSGRAGSLDMVFCILDENRLKAVLEPLLDLVKGQIGIVTISDVEGARSEHF